MQSFKANVFANYSGGVWNALLSVGLVPVYISFIGMEAYGLIGILETVLGIFGLLDFGLTTTVNREMARLTATEDRAQETRDFFRSVELVYWGIGAVMLLAFVCLVPVLQHWVRSRELAPETIQQSVLIAGAVMAARWPYSLYAGGLMGLERQVSLNLILAGSGTLRGVGSVLVLWLISPTVQAYLICQGVTWGLQTGIAMFTVWRNLPTGSRRARLSIRHLTGVWRFSWGVAGLQMTGAAVAHMDRVVLSRMLPLDMFGYYNLASTVAQYVALLGSPVWQAAFPRFSRAIALGYEKTLAHDYHLTCQLVTVAVAPASLCLAAFPSEFLLAWTGSPAITANASEILSLLIVAYAFQAFQGPACFLLLAQGYPRGLLLLNLLHLALLAPLLVALASYWGAVGGALAKALLCPLQMVLIVYVTHLRVLTREQGRWYLEDVGMPLLGGLIMAYLASLWAPEPGTGYFGFVRLGIIGCATMAASALTAHSIRRWVFEQGKRFLLSRNKGI